MSKVLIIEDSPVQALSLQQLLEQEGVDVLHALNGPIGIQMARESLPDAIVLDVEMPYMDGVEVCRRLQDDPATSDIPVIMLTIHSDRSMLRESLLGGAVDFIPKDDFANMTLLETLHQMGILPQRRKAPTARRE
jgi:CheY-like chemotaxis protein